MGFKKKWRKSPPELVALFGSVVPEGPGIERRQMFGYPCAFVNGNMFTGLHQESLIIRLSEPDREEMRTTHGASLFKPFGPESKMTMREYVAVPKPVLADVQTVGAWVVRAVAYASSLPPKHRM